MGLKPEEAIIIGSLVAGDIRGEAHTLGTTPTYVGVFPTNSTGGPRAQGVLIRPTANCRFTLGAVPNTAGLESAFLAAATEYVVPLTPRVQTLGFLDDQGQDSNPVYLRWVLPVAHSI